MNVGYQDRTAGAVEHCEAMKGQTTTEKVSDAYDKLATYIKEKLWHQLTMQVLEVLQAPQIYSGTCDDGTHSFLALYDQVVTVVDSKLNPLSLAKIAALVAQNIAPSDVTAAKAILENLLQKSKQQLQQSPTAAGGGESGGSDVDSNNNNNSSSRGNDSLNKAFWIPATVYVESKLSCLLLGAPDTKDDVIKSTLATLKTNKDKLAEFPAEGNSELAAVHAAHYEASMLYYKRMGPPELFYEQALSYLQHMGDDFGQSNPEEATKLAIDLITAALTGEGVYNLGQVEQTPVLKLLENTPHAWLVHILQATAAGNVALFRQYQTQYAKELASQPALVARADAILEKLTLLALVTLVFSKPSHERNLSFDEIASALLLDNTDQVEWIVMRALSVKLMEGHLDQVDQTVHVTWVMPRILNPSQIQQLAQRYGEWATKVSTTQDTMEISKVLAA